MLSYDCEARHIPLPLKQFKRQVSSSQTATQLPEGEAVRETYSVRTRRTEVSDIAIEINLIIPTLDQYIMDMTYSFLPIRVS